MKTYETELCVIAAGPAGLAAAIAGAEQGLQVLVLEKSNATGGTANMGMGPLGVETRQQREMLDGITREKAFYEFMNYTHWRSDALLVKKYIDKSASTIEWLEDMGVEFAAASRFYKDSEATWHYVKPDSGRPGPRAASAMTRCMTDRAKELGVEILFETWGVSLEKDETGAVCAVLAKNAAGEDVRVDCLAAVIATGGFAGNPEWIKKYTGYTYREDIFSYEGPGLTGDGIRMAWEAGAGRTDMTMELNYMIPDNMGHFAIDAVMRQPSVMVNLQGERFYNEDMLGNGTYTTNAISMQKGRMGFIILDESIKEYYRKHGLDLISIVHGKDIIDQFEADAEAALAEGYPHFFMADSVEELREKTGIDPDGLKRTLEVYNHDCQGGRDTLFGKDYRYMRPITGPKLYAARFVVAGYGSLGGIKINHKTEVVTQNFDPIPGLYAAGTDACSIYGDSYVFLLPGNTMGFALNSGRMAGENAAEYIKNNFE